MFSKIQNISLGLNYHYYIRRKSQIFQNYWMFYHSHLCIGRSSNLLQIILCSSGYSIEENALSHTATQHHTHAIKELFLGKEELLLGEVLGITKSFSSRNDGNLEKKLVVKPLKKGKN